MVDVVVIKSENRRGNSTVIFISAIFVKDLRNECPQKAIFFFYLKMTFKKRIPLRGLKEEKLNIRKRAVG